MFVRWYVPVRGRASGYYWSKECRSKHDVYVNVHGGCRVQGSYVRARGWCLWDGWADYFR